MTTNPPAPEPRIDADGVPWCDDACPLCDVYGYCSVVGTDVIGKVRHGLCLPAARQMAKDNAALKVENERLRDVASIVLNEYVSRGGVRGLWSPLNDSMIQLAIVLTDRPQQQENEHER